MKRNVNPDDAPPGHIAIPYPTRDHHCDKCSMYDGTFCNVKHPYACAGIDRADGCEVIFKRLHQEVDV